MVKKNSKCIKVQIGIVVLFFVFLIENARIIIIIIIYGQAQKISLVQNGSSAGQEIAQS